MNHIPNVRKIDVDNMLEQILQIDPDLGLRGIIIWHADQVEALLNPNNFDTYDEIVSYLDYYCHMIDEYGY